MAMTCDLPSASGDLWPKVVVNGYDQRPTKQYIFTYLFMHLLICFLFILFSFWWWLVGWWWWGGEWCVCMCVGVCVCVVGFKGLKFFG
jgi:hypothetical protein